MTATLAKHPVRALWERLVKPAPPEPSYPPLPLISEDGQAAGVPGLYVIGEVAGVPLIKLGLNAGHEAIDRIAGGLPARAANAARQEGEPLDVVIVGAGAAGVGATARAVERGLSYVTLEANQLAQTVVDMTKGKVLFAEPTEVKQKSSVWFEECSRETFLEKWRQLVRERGYDIRERTKVEDIQRRGELFEVKAGGEVFRARRVVLAIGKAGNPRKAGVPGEREHAGKIAHRLEDAAAIEGKRVCIYGGGDVALEASLALCDRNEVTLVTIDTEFIFPKKRNVDAARQKEQEGKLRIVMATRLVEVRAGEVVVEGPKGREALPNELLYEMIGSELPLPFLKRVGLQIEGEWGWRRWALLLFSFAVVYMLYAWKKGFPLDPVRRVFRPELAEFPWNYIYQALPVSTVVNIARPLGFEPGFWYSALYTVLMVVFGALAMRRWRSQHQRWRYLSLIGFQAGFFLLVNLGAPVVVGDSQAWRAWGLYQPWPLFSNTFYWFQNKITNWDGITWFFVGFGVFLVLVFMPLMARYQGKRFCTWICGCGGLAETLADRWRHLAPKGKRSRQVEWQGLVIFGWALVALVATFTAYDGNAWNPIQRAYAFIVDYWLIAIIPVALYPLYGGKVWCRYWCPLAAYNQVLSKWFGKLKIKANEKCINCTLCSRYCQVGVDVMSFAKNQQAFDNRNSACIHCGICIEVCPMKVLSFDSSPARKVVLAAE